MQRAAQRAEGGDDARAEVGAGRGDDAGGEGGGVEAVVDGGDEVLLDRPRVGGRRLAARTASRGSWPRHARSASGLERLLAVGQAMQRARAIVGVTALRNSASSRRWAGVECRAGLQAARAAAVSGKRRPQPVHGLARRRRWLAAPAGTRRAGSATGRPRGAKSARSAWVVGRAPSISRRQTSSNGRGWASSTAEYWR